MDSYVNHFSTLLPPLAPNEREVQIYENLIGDAKRVLLLGYTKQLLHLSTEAIDLNPPADANGVKITKGNWFDIPLNSGDRYDVIIGDGVLNLVGGSLIEHLSKCCSKLVIRFFTEKIEGMKYATYFKNNISMPEPSGPEIETQKSCKIMVWEFRQ